jgi:hypothetical protein
VSFLLALRLVAVPEQAWADVSAACKSEEGLPPPIVMGGVAALCSVVSSAVGASVLPGTSVSRVVVWTLAAVAGYFGSVAAAMAVSADRLGISPEQADLVPRFAASAVLPLAASGSFNFVPFLGLTFVWTVASCALTARSAWVGAYELLRLEGDARMRAALTVASVALVPVLFPLCFRALFES